MVTPSDNLLSAVEISTVVPETLESGAESAEGALKTVERYIVLEKDVGQEHVEGRGEYAYQFGSESTHLSRYLTMLPPRAFDLCSRRHAVTSKIILDDRQNEI